MAVIETVGLTKQYPSVTALDRLDVTVGDGVTGLVGANGAGKSTLIKILLGLVPSSGGTATVLGHDIAHDGAAIRASVGAMRKTFAQIRKDGGIHGVESQIATVEDVFDLQGMAKVKDDEKRFLR